MFAQANKIFATAVVVVDVSKSKIEFILPLIPKFIELLPSFEKGKAYKIK